MICKECITLPLCRNKILRRIDTCYRRPTYLEIYSAYFYEVRTNCGIIYEKYVNIGDEFDTKQYVKFMLNELGMENLNDIM